MVDPSSVDQATHARHRWYRLVICVVCFAALVRSCVQLHPYSGMNTPPTYGDYEAQRHWMEITVNLPMDKWYVNGPGNNLSYWGLDYPPLSGYQSWLCGKFIGLFSPETVELGASQGYETPFSKLLMRWTVMIADVSFYIPMSVALAMVLFDDLPARLAALVFLLLNPALIIIDHGHFQYNNISLGLVVGAVAFIGRRRYLSGAILFCGSLNHKQMSLYFAPAFFAHLFGLCLRQETWPGKIYLFSSLGVVVLSSFTLMWAPFLSSVESATAVIQRIFPTHRGLFEDYVGNFWCVSSLLIKWKRLISGQTLFRLCTMATIVGFLPSMLSEIWKPSKKGFLACLATSAFSFYLFSFQVHEKSNLLPLLPMTMMSVEHCQLVTRLTIASMLSMYPLLKKDLLVEAYWGLLLIHLGMVCFCIASLPKKRAADSQWHPLWLSIISVVGIHVITSSMEPPLRYPYLWDAVMVSWAFVHFVQAFVELNKMQIKFVRSV